jgi:hypothetical protein
MYNSKMKNKIISLMSKISAYHFSPLINWDTEKREKLTQSVGWLEMFEIAATYWKYYWGDNPIVVVVWYNPT